MIDVARLKNFFDVVLFDLNRLSFFCLSERALPDLQCHPNEVEGFTTIENSRLILVMVVPDLFNDRVEELSWQSFTKWIIRVFVDELSSIGSFDVWLAGKYAIQDLGHVTGLNK